MADAVVTSWSTLGLAVDHPLLGWADDRAALDQALAGWQQHMDGADSLSWVRARLGIDVYAVYEDGRVELVPEDVEVLVGAVDGDPLRDVTLLEKPRFVMKGGAVVKEGGGGAR